MYIMTIIYRINEQKDGLSEQLQRVILGTSASRREKGEEGMIYAGAKNFTGALGSTYRKQAPGAKKKKDGILSESRKRLCFHWVNGC